jgi:hypothetical protein
LFFFSNDGRSINPFAAQLHDRDRTLLILDKNANNKDVVIGYDLGAEKVVAEWSSAGLNVQSLCPVTRDAQFTGESTFLGKTFF